MADQLPFITQDDGGLVFVTMYKKIAPIGGVVNTLRCRQSHDSPAVPLRVIFFNIWLVGDSPAVPLSTLGC